MNSNLQNKLSRFESTPPAGVWDRIAGSLNDEQTFPQRLSRFEEQPPAELWQRVENYLDNHLPAKVVPFLTRYKKPVRYIAAASIIALILVSTSLLMKRTDAGPLETATKKILPAKKGSNQPSIDVIAKHSNVPDQVVTLPPIRQAAVYQQSPAAKKLPALITPRNFFDAIVFRENFVPREVDKTAMFSFSSLNDYMVYSDGEGNAMKLPKKLFSLVNCPDGDGSCRERIQRLQEKLSNTQTNADFTGILEMLRQLQ